MGFVVVAIVSFWVGCSKPEPPVDPLEPDGPDTLELVHDYVDLGLPNGTLWATCNVGADSPEDEGEFFSWGETAPKEVFGWKNYQYGNLIDEHYEFTKYCSDSVYGLDGFVDDLILLEPADDVAATVWGSDWRMPTKKEWEELFENTVGVWSELNGVEGWLLTAPNGNTLFLPAAGYWWNDIYNNVGLGLYWSSTLNTEFPYRAWGFHFNVDSGHICGSSDRCRGQVVRAVRSPL